MTTQERTLPSAIIALVAIAAAIGTIALASDLGVLSLSRQASGTGLNSPPECEGPNVLDDPDLGTDPTFTVTLRAGQDSDPSGLTLPAGPINAVCIKSGSKMFGGSGHSGLITTNGDYGDPAPGHPNCYTVSGLGTTEVTITRNLRGPVTGPANDPSTLWCQQISHVDVPVQSTPTPTPTPTPTVTATATATPIGTLTVTELVATATPTPTPAVLGLIQGPTSLPATGATPASRTLSDLSMLLGLAGLALLSGVGTLVAARRRR